MIQGTQYAIMCAFSQTYSSHSIAPHSFNIENASMIKKNQTGPLYYIPGPRIPLVLKASMAKLRCTKMACVSL